ncbi:uncharacterized protein PG998_000183 [Apiospora kogelbergensis]|uniref:uncharacterized protein n=1 Tax=Apiospora kogelbergensis TaxID=1337665 RepID=UPI003130E992
MAAAAPETPQLATSSPEFTFDLGGFLSYLAGDHFHDMPGYYANADTGQYEFRESDEFLAMWEGFELLACSPWWTRAWTAQEIILPPRATFLHCDATPCDYQAIEDADQGWWRLVTSTRACCKDAVQRFPRDKMRTFQTFLRKVYKLDARRSVSGRKLDGRDNFFVVVRSFSDRQCKMNQDKVFSLWSQARDECYKGYELDYKSPIEAVFTEVFTRMLKEASTSFVTKPWPDFRVLYGSGFGPTASLSGKPSWVQNFSHFDSSASMDAIMDRMTCSRLYRAAGWETGIMEVSGRELHLHGQKVDKIRFVTNAVENASDKENLKMVFTEWYGMLGTHLGSRDMTKVHVEVARLTCADVYHASLPPWQRLMKAILFAMRNALFVSWRKINKELDFQKMGDSEQWRRALPLDYPWGSWWQDFIRTGDLEIVDGGYRDAVEAAMTGRAMFITGSLRLMGLCQPQAREGDEVWIVDGARMPFVLRPIEAQGSGMVQYCMVGDCFVHGCMDGEYARSQQQRERITIV